MQTEMLALLTPAQHAQYSHDMKTQAAIQASLMKKRAAFMKAHQSDITSVRQLQVQFNNSITPAQHAQMEKIKADVMAQENQLRANLTMSQQDKIQQDQTIMAQARAKAAQLLTPTQKAMIQHIQQLTSKLNVAAQAALTH